MIKLPNLIWQVLSNINGLGNKTLISLYRACPDLSFDNLSENYNNIKSIIKRSNIISQIDNYEFLEVEKTKALNDINFHEKQNIKVISIDSEYYPKLLKEIDDPPILIYAKGNIELLKNSACVAIIGTRNPTNKGLLAAKKIARLFANNKYTIVSGLAIGIDTAGHQGALEASNGKTIAVLASGLDKIYPKENSILAENILSNDGLLISEYPINSRPFKSAFVQRDRIQSGLSLAVCPVQTPIEGGTQHTIRYTMQQKRILFCPYPQESEQIEATQGIYNLINYDKALVINDSDDYFKIIDAIKQKAKDFNVNVPEEFINFYERKIPENILNELDTLLQVCKVQNIPLENLLSYIKKFYTK